ncbi:MAG: SusC/RagA family TonB-linked outer membrane protein [Bacteroidales bacterium]|nr:SusC/RagA family TonB-linked outer membrane protein [Bacteroidales bacterium]
MKKITFACQKALALFMAVVALLLVSAPAFAQGPLSGKVIDANGDPVIGAGIVVKGTTNGTVSDVDGSFTLNVAPGTALEISCVGYVTQEVAAARNMTVTLAEDVTLLEETVVVGYGTMKKSDVTGAMVSVSSEELVSNPVNNAIEALQGKAAGVVVSSAGMRPGSTGSIQIRGRNSISASTSPLVVIDGVVSRSVGLDMLNPQDIESIDILKDASATAIYGAQGGNGVVLVTTKKGYNGRFTLNYNTNITLEKIYDVLPTMTASEAIEWRRWAKYYAGVGPRADEPTIANDAATLLYGGPTVDPASWANILRGWGISYADWAAGNYNQANLKWDGSKVIDTDWTQFTDRIGISQEHSLSASYGNDRVRSYTSLGYLDNQGTNIGQDFKRYTFRTSVDLTPVPWFSIGGSINLRYSEQLYGIDGGNGVGGNSYAASLHEKGRAFYRYAVPYDDEGNRVIYPGADEIVATVIGEVGKSDIRNMNANVTGTFYTQFNFDKIWDVLKGLTFKTTFGPQMSLRQGYRYLSSDCANRMSQGTDYVSSNASKSFSWTLDNIIAYNRTFGDHSVDVTLLQEAMSSMSTQLYSMSGTGVALGLAQSYWGLNPNSVKILDNPSYNSLTENQLASYMARVAYNFKNRYLLTLSYRYDGASQLGEGHKWHGFPSVALGWRIDQEDFMKGQELFSQLKLRLGWGKTGNYSVGTYSTKDLLSTRVIDHGASPMTTYMTPTTFANQAIGWETTTQLNAGLDFSILKGRISGVFDVYKNNTDGLIFSVTLPSVSGFTGTNDNVGKITNYGFDFSLNSTNIQTKNFSWRSTISLGYNTQKILELQKGKEDMVGSRLFIGYPISVVYGYETAGLWSDSPEDQAEMAKFNANKHNFQPGYTKVIDQPNADGERDYKIDANNDMKILGNSTPLWNLGFNNTLHYKNWEMQIFMYGNFGFLVYTGNGQGARSATYSLNYWNENNKDVNAFNKPRYQTSGSGDSYAGYLFYRDGSWFKVRQIAIGYNVPRSIVQAVNLSSLKITVQLKNPFSIYQGAFWRDGDTGGLSYNRGLVFGLNVGF